MAEVWCLTQSQWTGLHINSILTIKSLYRLIERQGVEYIVVHIEYILIHIEYILILLVFSPSEFSFWLIWTLAIGVQI